MTAEQIIELLELQPHPKEGGFFRECYRSAEDFAPGAPFAGARSISTAIYYLLTAETYSAMHRLPGDEIFHFYLGDPVEMLELQADGSATVTILGSDVRTMTPQHVVRGGNWQGSRLVEGGSWALLGTTMAPGFAYEDYETGTAELLERFPATDGWGALYRLFERVAPTGSPLRRALCRHFRPTQLERARHQLFYLLLGVHWFGAIIPTGGIAIRRLIGARMRPYTLASSAAGAAISRWRTRS